MRKHGVQFILLLLVLSSSFVASAPMNRYTMWLKAYPRAIVADGRSDTTISAEVRDSNGRIVPDGMQVDFSTTQGIIERTARTSSGVARVRLQSSMNVCTAVVSAVIVGTSAVAQIRIDFLAIGTEMFDESFISISSENYLVYDMNKKLVEAADGVKIRSRGIEMTAQSCQMEARRTIIRARAKLGGENIIISRGDKRLEASLVYYDFMSMSGYIITPVEDGAKRLKFRARDFFTEDDIPDEKTSKKNIDRFAYLENDPESIFIKAKTIIIKPEEEIKFKKAEFYIDGSRLVKLPLHVESLRGRSKGVNQVLSYGDGGLNLDLPMYYSITNSSTGALHLKRGNANGWGMGSGKSPWQLDMKHEYNIGSTTEGTVTLENFTRGNDWGISWSQRKELSHRARLYTYFDYPSHNSLYVNADYTKSLKNHNFNLNLKGNRLTTDDSYYYASSYLQSLSKPIFNGLVNYIYTGKINYNTGITGDNSRFGTGVGLQLYGKQLRVKESGNISTSFSATRNFGSMDDTFLWGNISYYQSLGMVGQASFNYNYSHNSGKSMMTYERHALSTDFSIMPTQKLEFYCNATYGLNDGDLSAFGEFSYRFAPTWRFRVFGNTIRYDGWSNNVIEVGIAKYFMGYELMLVWSSDMDKIRVEFAAAGF